MRITLTICLILCLVSTVMADSNDVLTLQSGTSNWATTGATSILTTPATYYYRQEEGTGGKRYVQVFVVDPSEAIPMKDSVLYMSQPYMTDETDQEIRASLNITKLIEVYNAKRIKMKDKESSKKYGRDIYLEAVKLRDLRLVVTTIAKF